MEPDGELDSGGDGRQAPPTTHGSTLPSLPTRLPSIPTTTTCFPTLPADLAPDIQVSAWASLRQRANGLGDDDVNLEAFVTAEPTLKDHLTPQMALALHDPVERLIGHHLIDMVDEAGYLRADVDPLAVKLGAPLAMVERILSNCRPSTRPASSRAHSPSVSRSSSRSRTATTRRSPICSTTCTSSPPMISPD